MSSGAGASGGMKKTAWPEVKGLPAAEAAEIIKRDMPEADIIVSLADEDGTMDLVFDRVNIIVDTVVITPTVELAAAAGSKSSWPEVVGMSVEEAKEKILRDKADADIVALPIGAPVTDDGGPKPNRVRLFVDTVSSTPFKWVSLSLGYLP